MQRRASGRLLPYLGGAALLLLASTALHFYYRDNFATHYPIRALSAESMRGGAIPFWNWHAGGGQPLAGNPNTLTFYPDSLLYLVLPARVAFNAHFWIHLVAAFLAMRALTRGLGASRQAAGAAALVYTASGAVISSTAFYNLVTASALIPFALHRTHRFIERRSWRDAIILGCAFGLLILAGEPLMIASALLGAVIIAATGIRRDHLLRGLATIALAAVIASPLLVAWNEIASETERSGHRYSTGTALAASLPPLRLLEATTAPFLGFVTDLTSSGYMANAPDARWPPLFISVFIGALVIPALGARALRHSTLYAGLLAIAAFIALGRFNPVVAAAFDALPALRIARYPEKFALLATVAACVLIGSWMQEKKEASLPRWFALAGIAAILAGLAVAYPQVTDVAAKRLAGAAVLAITVLAAAYFRSAHAKSIAIALTIVPLLVIHAAAIPIDVAAPYVTPKMEISFGPRAWRIERGSISADSARAEYRIRAQGGDPLFGSLLGTRFALDRSPEGMYSLLSRVVQERASAATGPLRLRYARLLACDRIESRQPLDDLAPSLDAIVRASGNALYGYRVDRPLPYVFAPQTLTGVASIQQAVAAIESPGFDEQSDAVVASSVASAARGVARVLQLRPEGERLVLTIDAPSDAVVMINESYFGGWNARAGNATLRIFPVNIDRLGIMVPPGRSEIALEFGRQRFAVGVAAFTSLAALLGAAVVAWRRSSTRTAVPAR